MDIKEYISSGILEAYVLGALPQEEQEQVAAHIAAYPELADEVAAIEAAMQQFAEANAAPPPAFMQEQIWNAIREEATTAQQPVDAAPAANKEKEATKIIPLTRQERSGMLRWQRAAVLLVLLGSLLVNLLFWLERNKLQESQVAMQQRIDTMAQQQQQLAAAVTNYQKERDMLADPAMQAVTMRSMQKDHPMAATIMWNKDKGDAWVSLQKLPEPPKGMQYQLWAIKDGKPVDMGVIANEMVAAGGMQKVNKQMIEGQAFAISLEKEGGSPVPTMERIYVLGKVSS